LKTAELKYKNQCGAVNSKLLYTAMSPSPKTGKTKSKVKLGYIIVRSKA